MMKLLQDCRDVSAEEGVGMFLSILCHELRQKIGSERFQHSIATMHWWFKKVIRALNVLGTDLIKPVNRGVVQPEIQTNPKWYPYFEKCIGVIDGTHVAAWSPASRQKNFRGRKSLVTQNVMATCLHDMMFTFVYAGWEETANDSRVFLDFIQTFPNSWIFIAANDII